MSTVMSELRQDHSNVREILGLLSRQLDAVSDASGGDFELMRDIRVRQPARPHPQQRGVVGGREQAPVP